MNYKLLFLLGMIVLCVGIISAQPVTLTQNWRINVGTNSWLANDNATRSLDYNPTTDHIVVVSRTGGPRVIILNAATGDSVGKLDMTGITTGPGTFPINQIAVAADGAIYATNLTTTASASVPLRVYRWQNETASPTVAYEGVPSAARYGDAMAVAGTGTGTFVYVGGTGGATGNNQVAVLTTTDGSAFTLNTLVTLTKNSGEPYRTVMGISPVTAGGDFWVNTPNVPGTKPMLFSSTGVAKDSIPGEVASDGSATIKYFIKGAKKFLLIMDGTALPQTARIVDVTKGGAQSKVIGITPSLGSTTNLNATGAAIYDPTRNAMVALATNNAVASYTLNGVDDVTWVTFVANASTVPDTLGKTSVIQVRGSKAPLTWGGDSKVMMTNVTGDYWQASAGFAQGEVQFKFFTNAVSATGDNEHKGWEQDILPGGNRVVMVGQNDTTLPLQFINGTPDKQNQYFVPWGVSKPDSIEVWFRVNMQANESFNKSTQYIGVRGSAAPLDWGRSVVLTQEQQHGNAGSRQYDGTNFWSGFVRFPKSAVGTTVYYKYVILDANRPDANVVAWEDVQPPYPPDVEPGGFHNRLFTPFSDSTIYWHWWNNVPVKRVENKDTVAIEFRADLTTAIIGRGYTPGDTIQVRTGYFSTAREVRIKNLTKVGLTGNIYAAKDTIVGTIGKDLDYQYYMIKGGQELREIYYDFTWTGDPVSRAERRRVRLTGNTMTVLDTSTSNTVPRRQPRFQNTRRIQRDVLVTYTCDVRPAIYTVKAGRVLNDIQGTRNVTKADSILKWGLWMNGPAVGGWSNPGASDWGPGLEQNLTKKMYDDGTHGDKFAHDSVYTLQWQYKKDSAFVGQEFKFGIWAGDNEGGMGGYGNNHIENIDDSQPTATIASYFGSINPLYYVGWDYDKNTFRIVGVDETTPVPVTYSLEQNYPNPFNPSTTIEYSLPSKSFVTLKIYNLLGQEVMVLVNNEQQNAGKHRITVDAARLATGVYFYRLHAGSFVDVKKMVFVK